MTTKYSEQELVEKAAIEVFESLGYEHINCYEEKFGDDSSLGRQTPMDVVLVPRLKSALVRINPDLPPETIDLAIEEITRDRSTLNIAVANREIYKSIRDGVKAITRKDDGSEEEETVKVIDFDNPENNDFFLAPQFWITGEIYKRRADLIGFVNGLPLIFIELKATHKKLKNAYDGNLTDYRDTIPKIFWYNAFIILSNGSESKIGTITADWEHFSEWKKINSEGEEGIVSLDTIIKGTCNKERFLDIFENFILFQDTGGSIIKIVAKNHQYIGVNKAIEVFKNKDRTRGKLGIFWHTQGSGKSFSMIFFSQKILRKFYGNYTFVIVTDRKELDDQIYKNFVSVGAVTETKIHAENREHLKKLLRENHRNIFTLIHKFSTDGNEPYPVLSERKDIIVIADEAHRTQYDILAMNMRKALPNASFIAFTATPLIEGEEKTRNTFGDYISIYSFKQSVNDKATVPLYYENRVPEVQLTNETLSEDLENIIEKAFLDERQEEKLLKEFAREYHIITRDSRLERIAEDIVEHYIGRGYQGKAMVVSIDKITAVRMYEKVRKYWKKYIDRLKEKLKNIHNENEKRLVEDKIKYMAETDMAIVISGEQNEVEKFRKYGLDIRPHRKRMNQEDLATKFKNPDDPFRIVFVCAMWMTGFDVPCLSTIYLDKPMRNHTLMQTIARANRVFSDKPNGLIVDYVGIFRNLQKALAIYNPSGAKVDYPVRSKEELLNEFEDVIRKIEEICNKESIIVNDIISANKLETIKLLDEAVDILLSNEEIKREYLLLVSIMRQLYKGILPDPKVEKYLEKYLLFKTVADKIKSLAVEADISDVKNRVEHLLDESVEAKKYYIRSPNLDYGSQIVDLSKIDFESLKKRFLENKKHIETERLKNAINRKLKKMVRLNKSRISFLEKFQELLNEYNSGAINVEIFFRKLIDFAKKLNEEDKRGISENLTEEELAIFDLLYKEELTKKEKEKVKLVAKKLLEKLKSEKLVLDWRKRQQTRADVYLTIQTILDQGLPECYNKNDFNRISESIYQHIYDSYFGSGKSVYSLVLESA